MKPLCLLGLAFGFLQAFGVPGHATTMAFDSFEKAGSDSFLTNGTVIEAGFSVSTPGQFFSPNQSSSRYAGSAGLGSFDCGRRNHFDESRRRDFRTSIASTVGRLSGLGAATQTRCTFHGDCIRWRKPLLHRSQSPGAGRLQTYDLPGFVSKPHQCYNGISARHSRLFTRSSIIGIATVDAASVPDGGSTIALLGAVMTGLGCVRRRLS